MKSLYTKIEANERTLFLLQTFAIGALLLGLALDLLSLYQTLGRRRRGEAGVTGLPLVPWMLYLTASFFWLLRGDLVWAGILLTVMTIWHIGLHVTLHRLGNRAASHPSQ